MELKPLSDADWPEASAHLKDGFAGSLNVYRTMAHHPALLNAWAGLREHVVLRTSLGRQNAEVVILRTGLRLGSSYEWAQHVQRARTLGLTDARIASVRGTPEGMAPGDAALCRAVDDLFDQRRLPPDTRDALMELFGAEGVLDLMATVGFYSTLGFILNSFDTPLDEDIAAELKAKPLAGQSGAKHREN